MRLYSPEWVAAFNEAVAGLVPAEGVSFRMLQLVEGEGSTVRIALDAGAAGISLVLDPDEEPPPQVTVSLAEEDAAALATGALDPGRLLAEGRVRVRGDLAVLVAAQELLAEASGRLAALSEQTTS